MGKYIDADRLKAEIKHLKIDVYDEANQFDIGARSGLTFLESFIDSLQQEQPGNICSRCVYHNKTDDFCEYPYGGRKCSINENGVYECNGFEEIEQQEQPEVELEEEIDKEWKKCNPIDEGMGVEMAYIHIEAFDIIARHFYELGVSARKEESK